MFSQFKRDLRNENFLNREENQSHALSNPRKEISLAHTFIFRCLPLALPGFYPVIFVFSLHAFLLGGGGGVSLSLSLSPVRGSVWFLYNPKKQQTNTFSMLSSWRRSIMPPPSRRKKIPLGEVVQEVRNKTSLISSAVRTF